MAKDLTWVVLLGAGFAIVVWVIIGFSPLVLEHIPEEAILKKQFVNSLSRTMGGIFGVILIVIGIINNRENKERRKLLEENNLLIKEDEKRKEEIVKANVRVEEQGKEILKVQKNSLKIQEKHLEEVGKIFKEIRMKSKSDLELVKKMDVFILTNEKELVRIEQAFKKDIKAIRNLANVTKDEIKIIKDWISTHEEIHNKKSTKS